MVKETVKEESNERAEIFLDRIICKNKIKPQDKIKADDIKLFKSLLDVSRYTLWKKSSNDEKEMKKKYKEFYKKITKPLNSLQKHCKEIEKFKVNGSLENNISIYKASREKIEGLIGKNKKFSYATYYEPREVELIKKINNLINELNKVRGEDSKCMEFMLYSKIDPYVPTYTEFEKNDRKISKTKDPFSVKISAFIKYNQNRQKKEKEIMQTYFERIFKDHINDKDKAWKDLKGKLEELEKLISTTGKEVNLQKFISEKNGCDMNEEFGQAILKALQNKLVKEYGFNKEQTEGFLANIQEQISKKGILDIAVDVGAKAISSTTSGIKSAFSQVCGLFKGWFSSKNYEPDEKNTKEATNTEDNNQDDKQDDKQDNKQGDVTEEIRKIGEAFIGIREANVKFIELVKNRGYGREEGTMKTINGKYLSYIDKIKEAMGSINSQNSEKFGGLVKIKKDKEETEDDQKIKNENLEKIRDFVQALSAINSEIPKIKKEYFGAQDDSHAIKKLIKYYIKFVKDNSGVNIINKPNISEWKPPANISNTSKIKLSQAIPYVYYCVDKYEKSSFGLDEKIVEVIEESERSMLGMTLREIKKAVKLKNV